MTHAWLITGPPGSGRSNLAYAFATALLPAGRRGGPADRAPRWTPARIPTSPCSPPTASPSPSTRCGGSSPASQYSPSVAHYRVMVVEDADRMTERTSNVLLKALEEPPERTVWILCAPSEADLLPTIRSRVRPCGCGCRSRPRSRACSCAATASTAGTRAARRRGGAEPHRHGAPARHRRGGAAPPRRDHLASCSTPSSVPKAVRGGAAPARRSRRRTRSP